MADESHSKPPAIPTPHETYRTAQSLSAGQLVLDRYTLRKFLGRGGFGVVWLAKDEEIDLEVAIKFLSDLIVNNPEAVADLKRETRHSLRLTHPNIVRIHGFLQGPQIAAISMEYVDGGTMSGIKAERPQRCFNAAEIMPLLTQLIDALDYAHTRAQIVHRDLKPGNLMQTSLGELKVADFGISRSISDTHTRLSEASPTSGTPAYMSPQQMMGQSPRITDDIYSLGATIYDLLAGKPPFYTGDVPSQVLRVTPPPIAQRRQELEIEGAEPVPAEWEQALAACLAKAPENRPSNVREVAALLGLPVPNRPLTDSRPPLSAEGQSAPIGGGPDSAGSSASRGSGGGTGTSRPAPAAIPATGGSGSSSPTMDGPWNQATPPPRKSPLPFVLAGLSLVALAVSLFLWLNRPKPPAAPGGAAVSPAVGERQAAASGVEPPRGSPAPSRSDRTVPEPVRAERATNASPADAAAPGAAADEQKKMARLVELCDAVPGTLSGRRWDLAQRQLQEIATLDPNLPQLVIWQAELNAGRNAERGASIRESVQRALAERQWERADRENEQLLALIPNDPQGSAWRVTIAAGRQEELRSAPMPAAGGAAPPGGGADPAGDVATDDSAIRAVVDGYARSLEALDIDRYAGLWRSLSGEERRKLNQAFGQIRSQSVELVITSVEPAGTTAVASGHERRRVQMKQGTPQSIDLNVKFSLEKNAEGRWQIVRREYR